MTIQDEIKRTLSHFSPDERAFAEHVAELRIKCKMYEQQIASLTKDHADLWKVMLVILDVQPDKTLRIQDSQFLRFKEEYRIDRFYDEKSHEVVLRLLTVHDDIPSK
jgi:hypothetical protein